MHIYVLLRRGPRRGVVCGAAHSSNVKAIHFADSETIRCFPCDLQIQSLQWKFEMPSITQLIAIDLEPGGNKMFEWNPIFEKRNY